MRPQLYQAWLRVGLVAMMAAICVIVWAVVRHATSVDTGSLQRQVLEIAGQLHAPGDQDTVTAATSPLPQAEHIRYQIQQDLLGGMSRQAIIDNMVKQYGPSVLAAPLFRGVGLLAWILPWLIVVVILVLVVWRVVLKQSARTVPHDVGGEVHTDEASHVVRQLRDYL